MGTGASTVMYRTDDPAGVNESASRGDGPMATPSCMSIVRWPPMSLTFVTKPQGGTPRRVSGWGVRSIGDGKWVGGGEYDGDGGVHGVSDGSVDGERPEPAHPSAVATTIAINTAAPSLRTAESLEPGGPLPLSRGSGSPKPGWEIVEGCSILPPLSDSHARMPAGSGVRAPTVRQEQADGAPAYHRHRRRPAVDSGSPGSFPGDQVTISFWGMAMPRRRKGTGLSYANDGYDFDGFISYNHEASRKQAADLQRGLQNFARPWHRTRRAPRIFLDLANMAFTPKAKTEMTSVIDRSAWLILLATPEAALSDWVRWEIDTWLDRRPADRLIIVRAGGEVEWHDQNGGFTERSTALPETLIERSQDWEEEPLWIDLTAAIPEKGASRAARRRASEEWKSSVARLSATIRGRELDEVYG